MPMSPISSTERWDDLSIGQKQKGAQSRSAADDFTGRPKIAQALGAEMPLYPCKYVAQGMTTLASIPGERLSC